MEHLTTRGVLRPEYTFRRLLTVPPAEGSPDSRARRPRLPPRLPWCRVRPPRKDAGFLGQVTSTTAQVITKKG
jgi:hypothetical protein